MSPRVTVTPETSSGIVGRSPGTASDRRRSVMLLPASVAAGHIASLTQWRTWARTPHFVISFDPALGQTGEDLADAVASTCERDYASLQQWFHGITPASLPFNIRIQGGSGGASHAGCAATELFCDSFGGNNGPLVSMLVVAEADEVFMANQGAGWNCGASNGEALSRILATEIYPAQLNGFATAASWLQSTRQDFVSTTDPSDTNFVSTGCGTLFINYLRFQRGIPLRSIVVAGGATLEDTFAKLTGTHGAFAQFKALLDRFFPGTASNVANDNPFPLMFVDHFYTTSAQERDAAVHPDAVKLLRMYNPQSGDHFYTTSASECDEAFVASGYRFEGTAFFISPAAAPGKVALFRLYNPQTHDHFYTTSAAERQNAIFNDGYFSEGIAGFVFGGAQMDTAPVYRLYNPHSGDHFYTTSIHERDSAISPTGYRDEGIACYAYPFASYANEGVACHVFPTQGANTQPLYRLRSTATTDHFYTLSAQERANALGTLGYVDEGIACYAYASVVGTSIPLLRAYNPKSGDHFYTTSVAELNNAVAIGYQAEWTAAHVMAQPATGTVPLLRLNGATAAW